MDCVRVRESLLELPDGAVEPSVRRSIEAHRAGCPDCQRFHEALLRVDHGLSRHLRPPVLDPTFAEALRARLGAEPRRVWADWLPAAVHFASCGVATAACLVALPDQAGLVVAAAALITLVSHFLLTTAQTVLDAAGD